MKSLKKKIIPAKHDEQVINRLIRDEGGSCVPLRDGKVLWGVRKTYGANFAGVLRSIAADEVNLARKDGVWTIDPETGGKMPNSPAAKHFFSRSNQITSCACRLIFNLDAEGEKKLKHAVFCRQRLCPLCMYRLSRRIAWETAQIVSVYMERNPDMIPIMIGLSVRNPRMGELSEMLDVLCAGDKGAWQKLRKWLGRREITDYIRTVEVTFNAEKRSWHPHIHVLAFVHKDYFKKDNEKYVSQAELRKYWQNACKLDYEPHVDIRRVYDKKAPKQRINFDSNAPTMDLRGAILETSKYCVKPLKLSFDVEENTEGTVNLKDIVRELDLGFMGRRLRSMGGELKKIARELKIDDNEDSKDLIHTTDEGDPTVASYEEVYEYIFAGGEYYLTERREVEAELSEDHPQAGCGHEDSESQSWNIEEIAADGRNSIKNDATGTSGLFKIGMSIINNNAVGSDTGYYCGYRQPKRE